MVTGEPGAGKTTFVKRLCQIWSQQESKHELAKVYSLSEYTLVIPIILRLIRGQNDLMEILLSQLDGLSSLEIHAMLDCLDCTPEKVLLLCDGFDEFAQRNPIQSIIRKSKYENIKMIITTRPHGITMLKYLGSQAVEKFAQIIGFGEEQIKEYIELFYMVRKDAPKGERLYSYLQNCKKPELINLATIPIRLEMMCLLWSKREDLGENLVDLYIMFIQYLLDHLEQKRGSQRTPEKCIMDVYKQLLLKVASLANLWDEFGRMKTIMTHAELQESLGDYYHDAVDLGCLVKYNPTSCLQESDWMFTHLSLQEFFLACYLSNTDNHEDINVYTKKCAAALEKQELVLSFLSGMNAERANKLLRTVLITSNAPSSEMFSSLRTIASNFKSQSKMDLPLPKHVDCLSEANLKNLNCFFNSDKRQHNRNLQTLSVTFDNITNPVIRSGLAYIKQLLVYTGFNFQTKRKQSSKSLSKVAALMSDLTTLHISDQFNHEKKFYDIQKFLQCLPKESLTQLNICGIAVIRQGDGVLGLFKNLKFLSVSPCLEERIEPTVLDKICESVRQCKMLIQMNMQISNFPESLLSLQAEIRLHIEIYVPGEETVVKDEINTFAQLVKTKQHKPGIEVLNLKHNKLNSSGGAVGDLLVCLPGIEYLLLWFCEITADSLNELAAVVDKEKDVKLDLLQLTLGHNKITGGGCYLGNILKHTPHLFELDLYDCKLNDDDIVKMDPENTCVNVQCLRLSTELMVSEHALKLILHSPVKLLKVCLHSTMKSSTMYFIFRSLQHLVILSLIGYDLSSGRLRHLADDLPPGLVALCVAECNLSDIHDLKYLISKKPLSLAHLDVGYNDYEDNILELIELKHQMSSLRRLKIGPNKSKVKYDDDSDDDEDKYEDFVTAVKEELNKHIPDIKVYCDNDENMWSMYF